MGLITNLNTVSVYITDQDRALAFYRDLLGFEVTMDAGDENFRWLAVAPRKDSETSLVLIKVGPNDSHMDWSSRIGKHTGFVFYTEDLQKTYEELSEKGVSFPILPKKLEWGGFEATFADVDGNQFELVERPKFLFE